MTQQQPVAGRPQFPATYGINPSVTAGLLPWERVEAQLVAAKNYWVATTRPDGRPHVAPVWGLWLDGVFLFSTDPASRKGKNLAARPDIAVNLESGDDVVIIEGVAEVIRDAELLARFVTAYKAKYDVALDTSNPDYIFYRVRPSAAHAWLEQDFPNTATRWRFTT